MKFPILGFTQQYIIHSDLSVYFNGAPISPFAAYFVKNIECEHERKIVNCHDYVQLFIAIKFSLPWPWLLLKFPKN